MNPFRTAASSRSVFALSLAGLALSTLWVLHPVEKPDRPALEPAGVLPRATAAIVAAGERREMDGPDGAPHFREDLGALRRALAGASPEERAALLLRLRQSLAAADPAAVIAAIAAFLHEGGDAATGEAFTLAADGSLDGAPTLRVLLLDWLGRSCRLTATGEGAALGRALMQTFGSADEWALALRNVAWAEPAARDYLAGQAALLMHHTPWQAQPSAGWYEALDVLVHTGAVEALSTLGAWRASAARPDLRHASTVALDRLAAAAPAATMAALNGDPLLLASQPLVRADCFAKADLTQPGQRAAFTAYLGREDIGVAEKTKALSGLLTSASFLSNNLLTKTAPPEEPAQAADRLNATGDRIQAWKDAQQFSALQDPMNGVLAELDAIAKLVADGGGK